MQNSTIVRFISAIPPFRHSAMSLSEAPVKPARLPRGSRALQKGQQTKAAIVDAALGLATQIGLEGLSIGALAEVTQMSKSGVFAHFGSREELQISVIREYHRRFEEEVFFPAMQEPRGLPRLRALFRNWMNRTSIEIDSGCLYISGAVEFDDRTGPVREALAGSVKSWLMAMNRAVVQAKEAGHLRADIDQQQLAFEIHGLILALHYEARFLKNPGSIARAHTGFDNIIKLYGTQQQPAAPLAKVTRITKSTKI
jgi:AcrR family transcriptional regulator